MFHALLMVNLLYTRETSHLIRLVMPNYLLLEDHVPSMNK